MSSAAEEAAEPALCNLRCGDDDRLDLWRQLEQDYRDGRFCDLHLLCDGGQALPCHRLVLAAASPMMRRALLASTPTEEEKITVAAVAGRELRQVKTALDAVYGFLSRSSNEVQVNDDDDGTLAALGVDFEVLCSPTPVKQEMNEVKEESRVRVSKYECEDDDEEEEEGLSEDGDWLEQEKKRRSKRRRGRKRKVEEEDYYWEEQDYNEEDGYGDNDDQEEEEVEFKPVVSAAAAGRTGRRKKLEPKLVERKATTAKGAARTPEELYAQMSGRTGSVEVEMQGEALDVSKHIRAKYRTRTVYQTMMGLRRKPEEEGTYDALPLAWSILGDSEDVAEQYKSTCRALIHVLGFSDMEAYYDAQVYSRQGIFRQNNNHKTRYALRKQYAKASLEELEALMVREDVAAATRRREPKPPFPIEAGRVTMELDKVELSPEELDGIAFLAFFDDGDVSGWVLNISEDRRQEDAADCVKAAFEIWSRLKKDPRSKYFFMPKSPEMCRMYDRYIVPCETFVVAQEFLRDADGKRRERLLTKEKQCHECGVVFRLTNINEEQKFINHKRMHYIKNFKCECPGAESFRSYPEKKTHFQLFHSDGKFVKCDSCSFVANPEAVARHHDKWHADGGEGGGAKEYVCPTCGVTAKNKHGYYFHMMTHKVRTSAVVTQCYLSLVDCLV